jgi:hypothetical protein
MTFVSNPLHNRLELAKDFAIGKPNNVIAPLVKISSTGLIVSEGAHSAAASRSPTLALT